MENFSDLTNFYVIGISYKEADLYTRGKYSLSREQKLTILEKAKNLKIKEIFISSTCNRTEIYTIVNDPSILINLLCENSNGDLKTFENLGYVLNNSEAVNHIFKVGTGLDSQILGDFEIIGQLKSSVNQSKQRNLIGNFMERLMNCVIQLVKELKQKQEFLQVQLLWLMQRFNLLLMKSMMFQIKIFY